MKRTLALVGIVVLSAFRLCAQNDCIFGNWTVDYYPSFTPYVEDTSSPKCPRTEATVNCAYKPVAGRIKRTDNCGNTEYGPWNWTSWQVTSTATFTSPAGSSRDLGNETGTARSFSEVKVGTYDVAFTVTGTADSPAAGISSLTTTLGANGSFEVECNPELCTSCQGGSCGTDGSTIQFGSAQTGLKGSNIRMSLGNKENGAKPAGFLSLNFNIPGLSTGLFNPAALRCEAAGAEVIRDSQGAIRQVKTANGLVDVPPMGYSWMYQVKFYTNCGSKVDGLYQINGTRDLVSICTVANVDTSGSTYNQIRFTREDTAAQSSTYTTFSYASSTWEMVTGNGARHEFLLTNGPSGNISKTELRTITGPNTQVKLSETKTLYKLINGFHRLVSESVDPDGANLMTTNTYNNDGLLEKVVRPDGSWTICSYDTQKRLVTAYSAFTNQAPTTDPSLCRVKQYYYESQDTTRDDLSTAPWTPRFIVEKLLGNEIAWSRYVILNGERDEYRCATSSANLSDPNNLVTITKTNTSGDFIGYISDVQYPNGTIERHDYQRNGSILVHTVQAGVKDSGTFIAGTVTVTEKGARGELISVSVRDIESGHEVQKTVYSSFDAQFRPQLITYLDGASETRSYSCCGLSSMVDLQGIITSYDSDALGRPTVTTRDGIMTIRTLDAVGRELSVVRRGTNGSQSDITISQSTYDVAGRRTSLTRPLDGTTTFSETTVDGLTTRTTTFTDTGTRIELYARDGSLLRVTGTAAAPVGYVYGVKTENNVARAFVGEIKLGGAPNYATTTEATTNYMDALGRVYKKTYPREGLPEGILQESVYTPVGKSLDRDADLVTTLYKYNRLGQLTDTVVDMNQNDAVEYDGIDRITRVTNDVVISHGCTNRRSRTLVWTANNDGSAQITTSVQETSIHCWRSWSTGFGLSTETRGRILGNGSMVSTNIAPDGSYTITESTNGRVLRGRKFNANDLRLGQTTYEYDVHGRKWKATDARNGTTTYQYNNADQITQVTTPPAVGILGAQVTQTAYDNMGRPSTVTQPDISTVTYEYYVDGKLKKVSGSRTYPVEYGYDAQGRMTNMYTWRVANDNTTRETNTWKYDNYRGWLVSKRDSSANGGLGANYSYKASGRLDYREWARQVDGVPLGTQYAYDNAGQLSSVTYADGLTVGWSYYYDRRGQMVRAVDDNGSMTDFFRNDAGLVLNETNSGGTLNGFYVTNVYDNLLRRTTNGLVCENEPDPRMWVTNTYDAASRLLKIGDMVSGIHVTNTYLTDSPLLGKVTYFNGDTVAMATARNYDGLNRLTEVLTTNTSQVVLDSHRYGYNLANQRLAMTNSDSKRWAFGYDALGQVTSGIQYDSGGNEVAYRHFEYTFDHIGNRTRTYTNSVASDYVPNVLNQYVSRNNPTETFTHDADGNLTADAKWTYTWDGENRLLAMDTKTGVTPVRHLTFEYDYIGRRIRKTVKDGNQAVLTDEKFCYDGWNLLAVINVANNTSTKTFLWGLDLSGSQQGAGGVGGLLSIWQSGDGSHFACYDGNGNVMKLMSASSVTATANYEYSPFGDVVLATGTAATTNPFRFSTKYQDDETGLVYYGRRFLVSSTGRWLSRDPIGEQGGLNCYAFVMNDPPSRYDYLGLQTILPPEAGDDKLVPSVSLAPCTWCGVTRVNTLTGANGSQKVAAELDRHWDPHPAADQLVRCGSCSSRYKLNDAKCSLGVLAVSLRQMQNPTAGNPERTVFQHEVQHAIHWAEYATKVINAWQEYGKMCVHNNCDDVRALVLKRLEELYVSERDVKDATINRKDYSPLEYTPSPDIYEEAVPGRRQIAEDAIKLLNRCNAGWMAWDWDMTAIYGI